MTPRTSPPSRMGKAERGMQHFARLRWARAEISIMDDNRECMRAHGCDQTRPGRPIPGLNVLSRWRLRIPGPRWILMPNLQRSAAHPLPVGAPQCAHVPTRHSTRLEVFWELLLRESPPPPISGDGVLRHAAMLASLALVNVLHSAEHARGRPDSSLTTSPTLRTNRTSPFGRTHAVFPHRNRGPPRRASPRGRPHLTVCGME